MALEQGEGGVHDGGIREAYPYSVVSAASDGPPNAEVARQFLNWQRDIRRRKPITVYQYAARIDQFLEWIAPTQLDDVSLGTLERFVGRERNGGGKGADSTVAKECAILKGLYRYGVGRALLKNNPTALLSAPSVQNANPKPVDDETWKQLWGCELLPDDARVFLGLAYFVGLRRAEIVSVAATNVDTRREQISGLRRKGGGDDVLDYGQLVDILQHGLPELMPGGRDSLMEPLRTRVQTHRSKGCLLSWSEDETDRTRVARMIHSLPDGATDPQLVYRRLRRWLGVARLSDDALTPHMLRHSFVTNLLRVEMPIHLVSHVANHSSVAVTMRYAKLGGQDLRAFRAKQARSLKAEHDRWGAD